MLIETSAPGRCGLVGNPTDMYGGSVLSCSTAERATCTLIPGGVGVRVAVGVQSAKFASQADLSPSDDFLNITRAALTALAIDPASANFELLADTNIPVQAGLSGSTAHLVAVLAALLTWQNRRLNPYALAELVRKTEYETLGVVCGFQDAYMTVFGGLNFMDFAGRDSLADFDDASSYAAVEPLADFLPPNFPFLLAHTGVKHHSGAVHTPLRQRFHDGEPAAVAAISELKTLARPAKRALLSENWDEMAALMNRNHALIRELGGSGDANEKLILASLDGGATGAKLAGAGGGGTILVLTHDVERTRDALLDADADKILIPSPSSGLTVDVRE